MADAEPRRIDWGSASVEDGTLEVELAGASSKVWTARFRSVLTLLDTAHGSWGEVRLTKKRIRVDGLTEGSEAELRHLLESAVIEANSTLHEDSEPDRRATETADEDPAAERDRRLTETFRGFASDRLQTPR